MNKTQVVVVDVIQRDNTYLVTRRNQPETPKFHNKWQFPGGGLEFREHPTETAIREAQEELGIRIKVEKLIPQIFHSFEENWHGILIPYLCSTEETDVILNDEAFEYKWLRKEEIYELEKEGKTLEHVSDIINAIV
jgi:mutator protein MutT